MKKNTSKLLIHRDMIVGDIVNMFPEAADIITSYGLHCIGCHVNAYETIGEGLLSHGYTEEHLQALLKDLNEFIREETKERKSVPKRADSMKVFVTPLALQKILEIAKVERKTGLPLRVEVKKIGDNLKHSIYFIKKKEILLTDKTFSFMKGKVKIVADKRNYKITDGLEIDYIHKKDRAGFKMKNPNVPIRTL